jgi:hypothetical protein
MLSLLFILAAGTVNVDVVSVPLAREVRVVLAPMARCQIKRQGTVSSVTIGIDRIPAPSSSGPAFNTYVVWAMSPEGILDNLGELEQKGAKAQFSGTTRLTEFGVFITAEPHYMVDRPSSAVLYLSQTPEASFRRKTIPVMVGEYDYSQLKAALPGVNNAVAQARAAFQIAQTAGADRSASAEFREAQVLAGSLEELVNRGAPLDIMWPAANETIRSSQRAAAKARGSR